jgi:hypothetical protein
MRNHNLNTRLAGAGLLAVVAFVLAPAVGCNSTPPTSATSKSDGEQGHPVTLMVASSQKKGGAELWAENCTRCHNARPPEYYSDAQWDLIVHHMRLRANLTGAEARSIAEFLKASN